MDIHPVDDKGESSWRDDGAGQKGNERNQKKRGLGKQKGEEEKGED